MKRKTMLWPLLCVLLLSLAAAARADGEAAKEKPRLIAHAGGAVYGFRLTNSLEALDTAYANGFRCLELDLCLTSDGEIVLLHDWEAMAERMLGEAGRLSLSEYRAATAFMGLTLLDARALVRWLGEHPDCRVITDVKEEDNVAVLRALKELAGEQQGAFIPQIYNALEYDAVKALGYEDMILTLYRLEGYSQALLLQFMVDHPLWALTVPEARLEETLLDRLAAGGVAVYAHTVNDLSVYEAWREKGLYGIYTDHFQPNHWPERG